MGLNIRNIAARAATGTPAQSPIATTEAHLVPLFMDRSGVETTLVGVAYPDGRLFRFRPSGNRSMATSLRNSAFSNREGVPVTVDGVGNVFATSRSGKINRVGSVLDFAGKDYDPTASVTDPLTEEKRQRRFLPIALVLEDDMGNFVPSSYGTQMIREVISLLSDPDAVDRVFEYLTVAFNGHYQVTEEGLVGTSIEGAAFVDELQAAIELAYGDEDGEQQESESGTFAGEAEDGDGDGAIAGDPDGYGIG